MFAVSEHWSLRCGSLHVLAKDEGHHGRIVAAEEARG
jgi:hypothetical protein